MFWSSDANRRLIGKIPDAGKDSGQKEIGHQRMRWLDGINDAMGMNLGEFLEIRTGRPGMLQSVGSQRVRHN